MRRMLKILKGSRFSDVLSKLFGEETGILAAKTLDSCRCKKYEYRLSAPKPSIIPRNGGRSRAWSRRTVTTIVLRNIAATTYPPRRTRTLPRSRGTLLPVIVKEKIAAG